MPAAPRKKINVPTPNDGAPAVLLNLNPPVPPAPDWWQAIRKEDLIGSVLLVLLIDACIVFWSRAIVKLLLGLVLFIFLLVFLAGAWFSGHREPTYYAIGLFLFWFLPPYTSSYVDPIVKQWMDSKYFYIVTMSALTAVHGVAWFVYMLYAHWRYGNRLIDIGWTGCLALVFVYPLFAILSHIQTMTRFYEVDKCLQLAELLVPPSAVDACFNALR
jgi:hypothetical protein